MGISPKVMDGDVVPTEQGVVIGSPLPPFAPTHVSHKQVEAYPIAAAEFQADGSGRIALKGGILVIRTGLIALLGWAEAMAHALASITPAPVQQQFHAPLGDRSSVVEEPLVPRRAGTDPRLPGKRPHP